ncbi:MAG: hypothetical protein K6E33_04580 [Lachnospiraceae bacterium]|nr:hypothetical protein [Lachnospiraceae bacterium]
MINKLYIRADGNSEIATGHIMRCLAVASEVNALSDIPVSFIVSDRESRELLKSRILSFPQDVNISSTVETDVPYRDPVSELRFLRGLFTDEPKGFLLVDSYFTDNGYLSALRDRVTLGYIDDLRAFDPEVDLLINYTPGDMPSYRAPGLVLSGPDYAPIRREFAEASFTVRERVSKIWISCGGAGRDTAEMTEKALRSEWGKLKDQSGLPEICLLPPTSDMSGTLSEGDILISAAGSTLYEACAMGLPAVSMVTADNQIPGAEAFQRLGVIKCAGDIRKGPDTMRNLADIIRSMTGDDKRDFRLGLSENMKRLVDGKGARRIAEAILSF